MSAVQTDIFQRIAWTTRERHLTRLLEAVERTGHLREPEYAQGKLGWPCLRQWRDGAVLYRCAPLEPIAAYLQTRGRFVDHRDGAGECRYLLVSLDGYVLAEGEWCSTTGGARGWLGRSTVKIGGAS